MVYISSACIKNKNILDSIKELMKITNNIELSGGTLYQEDLLQELKNIKKEYEVNFLLHSYFPPPRDNFILNFADKSIKTKNFIEKSMNYVKELNINYYSVHSGFKKTFKFNNEILVDGKNNFIEESIFDNIKWFYNNYPNYKIALENLFPNGDNKNCCFMMSLSDIISVLDKNKKIYLLFDLGHLKVSAKYFNFDYMDAVDLIFSKYSNRILEIHLSENRGLKDEHLEVLSNSLQYEIVKKYKNLILENSINLVIESRINNIDILRESYSLFNKIFKGNL